MELYAVVKANRTGVVVEEGNVLIERNDNIRVFNLDNIRSELSLTTDCKSLSIREYRKVIFAVPKKYRKSIYKFIIGEKYTEIPESFSVYYKIDMSWIKGKAKSVVIESAANLVGSLGITYCDEILNHDYLYIHISGLEDYKGYFGWFDNDNKFDFDIHSYFIEVGINDVLNCKSFKDLLSMAENKNRKR